MRSPTSETDRNPPSADRFHGHGDAQPLARLYYRIKSLQMAGAVLHLGAHPDDEDSGMIAYMAHRLGVRVVYWSATRGEGGQNRRGPETSEALGIVRSWESLDARAIDGGEVLYGPFRDFGFSKSGDDTLERWGRDALVKEIVRAIRMTQPLVVISRWNGDAGDGHGHHRALGLVVAEAFEAAADPACYPDLARQGLAPWQAKKLYRSVAGDWQPGETGTFGERVPDYERGGYLGLDTGAFDPVMGLTYQEQGVHAINCHLSQGMNFVPARGPYHSYYCLERSLVPSGEASEDVFAGLDPTLTGLAEDPRGADPALRDALQAARSAAETAAEVFHPDYPERAGRAILDGLVALRALDPPPQAPAALATPLARILRAFESTAAACFGLQADLCIDRARLTPGSRVSAMLRLWSGAVPARCAAAQIWAPAGWTVCPRPAARPGHGAAAPFEEAYEIDVPVTAALSTPYWLRAPSGPYAYAWPATGPLAAPFDPPMLGAAVEVEIEGTSLRLGVAAVHRSGMMGGFRDLPISVLPAIAVSPRRARELFPLSRAGQTVRLDAAIRCVAEGGTTGTVALAVPDGWRAEPARIPVEFARSGESRVLRFDVTVPAEAAAGVYALRYEHDAGLVATDFEPVRIGPPGAAGPVDETNCTRETFRMRPAVVALHVLDAVFVPTLRYGYLTGLKEEILPALSSFGLPVSVLSDDDLAFGDLTAFHAIVVGPNAYHMRQSLRDHAGRLLDYVAGGGTLIVQYQGYGYDVAGLAPFPFRFNQPHDRVTRPDAPVAILDESHPILRFPNTMTPADFEGWVDQRGLYFFGDWDSRYVPLLASQDSGEHPLRGGLLCAAHGRGSFVYVAYSLFRQIPAGVPGGLRLFANLLGLPEARIRQRMAFLRSIDLLASMSDAQLHQLAQMMHERRLESGTYLAREGELGSDLFVVAEGTIEVVKQAQAGERVVSRAMPGEAIGEFAMLANIRRSAGLRAAGEATIFVLPATVFQDQILRYPDLSLRVMEMLVRKLIAHNEAIDASEVT